MAYPTTAQIKRAVEAARKAGLQVAAISCYPDGRIDIRHGEPLDRNDMTGDPILDAYLRADDDAADQERTGAGL